MQKKLLAIILTLSMLISMAVIVPVQAVQVEKMQNSADDTIDGDIGITSEVADAIISSMFGEASSGGTDVGDGYEYHLTGESYEALLESITGEVEMPEEITTEEASPTNVSEANSNSLPEDYVDTSNDGLKEILKALESPQPRSAARSFSAVDSAVKVDVVFAIDSTGSMGGTIEGVKNNIAEFAGYLNDKGINLRLGLIDFKDCRDDVDGLDSTVVHRSGASPWFTSYGGFVSALTTVTAYGGGDDPETPFDALGYLTDDSTILWSSDAYKFVILVTDVDYHNNNRHGISNMTDMIRRLQERGIYASAIVPTYYSSDYFDLTFSTGGIIADIYSSAGFSALLKEYADSVTETALTDPVSYSIKITNAAGLPVEGARVSFSGGGGVSGTNGIAVVSSRKNLVSDFEVSKKPEYEDFYIDSFTLANDKTIPLTLVGITSDEDPDGTGIDPTSLFETTTEEKTEIVGPEVNIWGNKFNIFKLGVNFKLPIFDKLSFKWDTTKKTVGVIVGSTVAKGKETVGYWKDYNEYKNFVKKFNSAKPAKDIRDDFLRLPGMNPQKSKFVFPTSLSVAGYVDLSYASGKLDFAEGGIVVKFDMKWESPEGRFPPPGSAFYCKLEIKLDASAKVGVIKVVDTGKISFKLNIATSLGATIKGGIGIEALHLEIGLNGKLELTTTDWQPQAGVGFFEKSKLVLKGAFVWEGKAGWFKIDGEIPFGDGWQILPPKAKAATMLASFGEEDLKLIPRPVKNQIMAFSLTDAPEGSIRFDENIYNTGDPQLVELNGGKLLMVWLGDDASRNDINASTLYYSIYDGSNWSPSAKIDDNGTADFSPSLYKDENDIIHLVWQNVNKEFAVDAEPTWEDYAESVDISYVTFSADGTLISIDNITGNDSNTRYEVSPIVAAVDGEVSIGWLENSQNDMFMLNGTNSIHRAKITNEELGSKETIASSLPIITNITNGYDNGTNVIAYTTATLVDGDLIDDSTIHVIGVTSGTFVNTVAPDEDGTTRNAAVNNLQLVNGSMYWSDADGIKCIENIASSTIVKILSNQNISNFKLIKNGDNAALVGLTNESSEDIDGVFNEIYAMYNDGASWSNPIVLTEYGKVINSISGVIDENETLTLAFNQVTLKDSSYTGSISDLVVAEYERSEANIVVDPAAYIPQSEWSGNNETYISVYTQNIGAKDSPNLKATVEIDSGTESTETLYAAPNTTTSISSLAAHSEMLLYVPVTLPANLSSAHSITVTIVSEDGGDTLGTSNKIATYTVTPLSDIEVSEVSVIRVSDGAQVTAKISNVGDASAENVTVELFDEGDLLEGSPIDTKSVGSLSAGTSTTVTFDIGSEYLNADSEYDYKRFIVNATTTVDETNLSNNSESVLLAPLEIESINLETDELHLSVGETAKIEYSILPTGAGGKDVTWHSENLNVVSVDADGTITALRNGNTVVRAISVANGEVSQTANVYVTGTSKAVSNIHIDQGDTYSLTVGGTTILTATIEPEDAINKGVVWSSSNTSVVTVTTIENSGSITGVREGTATVYAVTNDGGYQDSITIKVNKSALNSDATLSSLSLGSGITLTPAFSAETTNYTASVPNSVSSVTIIAMTNNSNARVIGTGAKSLNVGENEIMVTVTAEDGTTSKTYKITVTRAEYSSGGYIPPYIPSPSYPDNSTNNTNTSSPSSGTTTPSSTVTENPVVQINGISADYTVDKKGNVLLTPTQAQMNKIISNAKGGVLTIDIGTLAGINSISLDFNMPWIPKTINSISVSAKGIGSYEIKYATLAKFNGKITLILKKGSLITDILVDGKSVSVIDYANPMIVSMPYTLKSGELASQIVMTNKTTGKVIPRSYYKDGYVYATVYSTGHFEPAYITPKTFTDTSGTWSDQSVKYISLRGVINGITETTFEPDTKITREQYITMLVRMLDLTSVDYSDTEAFSDVDKSNFYYSVIMQARTLGITNGIGNNKFGMKQFITLEDMYTMTYRAMKQFGMVKDFDKTKGLDNFADVDKVSLYAVEAIQNLLQNNIVKSEVNLNPKVTASRSITALLMYRLLLSEK